jgi:molecular chaperone GrpE
MTRKQDQQNEQDVPLEDASNADIDPTEAEAVQHPTPPVASDDESIEQESAADQSDQPDQSTDFFADYPESPIVDDEIERLQEDLAAAEDRMLRAHAELDNFRKRINRQMDDERRYAAAPLIRDLLPIWDNMGRALEAAQTASDVASVVEGMKIVADQLTVVFERHHCVKINALHEPFDPNRHESIMVQPSDEFEPNTVLMEIQSGFQLHDRVVRPTQVIVSTKPEPPASNDE